MLFDFVQQDTDAAVDIQGERSCFGVPNSLSHTGTHQYLHITLPGLKCDLLDEKTVPKIYFFPHYHFEQKLVSFPLYLLYPKVNSQSTYSLTVL